MFKNFINPKLLIPVAAFAVTVTGASAFTGGGGAILDKLNSNLTDTQKSALVEAQTIRQEAGQKAEKVLSDAGIDKAKLHEIRTAMHTAHNTEHKAIDTAVAAKDFSAFKTAVKNTPLANKIVSEDQFNQFVKAHDLMKAGDKVGAKAIMDTLGIAPQGGRGQWRGMDDGDREGVINGHGMWNKATTTIQ